MKIRDLLFIASTVAATSPAFALSLSAPQGSTVLGSPLNVTLQLQPDAGENAASSCVSASIWMGDTMLPAHEVSISTQGNTIRVWTQSPIQEPLVNLRVTAGCSASLVRSYTLFADPPSSLAATVKPIDLQQIQVRPSAQSNFSNRPFAPAAAASSAAAPTRTVRRTAKRLISAQAAQSVALAELSADALAGEVSTSPAAASTLAEPLPSAPRLRMEPLMGLDANAPIPGASPSASTADALPAVVPPVGTQADALSAAGVTDPGTLTALATALDANTQAQLESSAQRLKVLEEQLLQMQSQLQANRTEITSLNSQLTQADNQGLPTWVLLMLGLLALAMACIAWLLQRLKQVRENAKTTPWAAPTVATSPDSNLPTAFAASEADDAVVETKAPTAAEAAMPVPATDTVQPLSAAADTTTPWGNATAPAARPTATPAAAPIAPLVMPVPNKGSSASSHLVELLSSQALFDVQEQAEFFASIGENEQAISILQSHIAKHAATSPQAYLELLQLLFRLSRKESFEQVRASFEAHFNVHTPDFLRFNDKGQDLWQGYPQVLASIEAQWNTDQAQEVLRQWIVKQPIALNPTLFDLAAFETLLALHNTAKTTPAATRGPLPVPGPTDTSNITIAAPDAEPLDIPTSFLPDDAFVLPETAPSQPSAPAVTTTANPTAATHGVAKLSPHFQADETLMHELSLEWSNAPVASTTPAPSAGASTHPEASKTLELDLNALSANLQALSVDTPAPSAADKATSPPPAP